MDDDWRIEILKVMSQSSKTNVDSLGVKEYPYWDFVKVYHFICPILHNHVNFGNNVFHHLLDYGNECIEKLSVGEDMARNSLLLIDSSIEEKVNLRNEFDVSDERKELNSLKILEGMTRLQ